MAGRRLGRLEKTRLAVMLDGGTREWDMDTRARGVQESGPRKIASGRVIFLLPVRGEEIKNKIAN
jgi:hypothetical protein